jgi:YD repeat-containing protein
VLYPSGNGSPFVTNVYDSLGRVKQQTDASGHVTQGYFAGYRSELVNGAGDRHAWYMDAAGRVLSDINDVDGLALTATTGYDGQGNPILVTKPSGEAVATTYDALFNPLTVTVKPISGSAAATAGQTLVTMRTYTTPVSTLVNFERVATTQDPLGNMTTSSYDTSGNLIKV